MRSIEEKGMMKSQITYFLVFLFLFERLTKSEEYKNKTIEITVTILFTAPIYVLIN